MRHHRHAEEGRSLRRASDAQAEVPTPPQEFATEPALIDDIEDVAPPAQLHATGLDSHRSTPFFPEPAGTPKCRHLYFPPFLPFVPSRRRPRLLALLSDEPQPLMNLPQPWP